MNHPEDFPGVAMCDLAPKERALVWAMRAIAAMPTCTARVRLGLASVLPAHRVALATVVLTRLVRAIAEHAERKLMVGVACARSVTWDEAALVALLCGAHDDPDAVFTWFRRLGVGEIEDIMLDDAVVLGVLFEGGAEALTAPAPRPEPEVLARREISCASSS